MLVGNYIEHDDLHIFDRSSAHTVDSVDAYCHRQSFKLESLLRIVVILI